VVAASLAERAWTVMRRGTPYVICDIDGQPVTPDQAKTIVAGRWTVPPEVRARRRSTKTGKAPRKSAKDNAYGAASPAPPLHRPTDGPSSQSLDKRSSIGNQPSMNETDITSLCWSPGWPGEQARLADTPGSASQKPRR
jgi:hypothetical protein